MWETYFIGPSFLRVSWVTQSYLNSPATEAPLGTEYCAEYVFPHSSHATDSSAHHKWLPTKGIKLTTSPKVSRVLGQTLTTEPSRPGFIISSCFLLMRWLPVFCAYSSLSSALLSPLVETSHCPDSGMAVGQTWSSMWVLRNPRVWNAWVILSVLRSACKNSRQNSDLRKHDVTQW